MTRLRRRFNLLIFVLIGLLCATWYLSPSIRSKSEIFYRKSVDTKTANKDNRVNWIMPSSLSRFNQSLQLPSVCSDELCRPDYFKHLQSRGQHLIPAIRHILWRNESVSEYFAEQLRSWHRIHPNWTYVLWRDQDLVPFVAKYFPGLLVKFEALKEQIMRVDMIRYLLLFRFGGVYADLDYSLVDNLDDFRRLPAVVTREPDAHSLQLFGISWPVKPLFSSAFLMSTPGHVFYHYVIHQLEAKPPTDTLGFAGPFGLTEIVNKYRSIFTLANNPMEAVYVPPSYSFYSYPDNRLRNSKSLYINWRISGLQGACNSLMSSHQSKDQQLKQNDNLKRYCTDVNNLDPITDRSQRVFAIHDMKKPGAIYANTGRSFYYTNLINAKSVIPGLKFGSEL